GLVADKFLGFRKTILWGGLLMMLGHFALGIQGIEGMEGNMPMFFGALGLIIVGNGFFKPNISSFLGKFYETDDPRKDGAFSIFYMGVNIGAFLAMLTCGYVGQNITWHSECGLAGIGMLIGLIVFWACASAFGDKGHAPKDVATGERKILGVNPSWVIMVASLVAVPICALM